MPIITVQGISSQISEETLENVYNALVHTTSKIAWLKLKEDDVSCFFPQNLISESLREEIIITVDGLFIKRDRTGEVRHELAKSLVECGKEFFPKAKIECFVHPFNPLDGFYSCEGDK
jgi:hypothetical protein